MKKLMVIDLLLFNLSFLLSYWLRIHSGLFQESVVPLQSYRNLLLFSNLVLLLVFTSFTLYKEKRGSFTTDEFVTLLKALLLTFVIVTATTFLYKATIYSRLILALTFILSLLLIAVSRTLLRYLLTRYFQKKQYVLIYKNDMIGKRLYTKLESSVDECFCLCCYFCYIETLHF